MAGVLTAFFILNNLPETETLQVTCNDDNSRCFITPFSDMTFDYNGTVVNGIYFPEDDWIWDIQKDQILLQPCSVYVSKEMFPCLEKGVYLD